MTTAYSSKDKKYCVHAAMSYSIVKMKKKEKHDEDNETRIMENLDICPECKGKIQEDSTIEYCAVCGLITRANTYYVAGVRTVLPYGLKI